MEKFSIPGVGAIIEKNINGILHILIQKRCKSINDVDYGLFEIPAGKIREYENIFTCLRREVFEETGLSLDYIEGENRTEVYSDNEYKVINYEPFSCSRNIGSKYPIMVSDFICKAGEGNLKESNESKELQWISLKDLELLMENERHLYPMHVSTLRKYLRFKGR